MMLNQYGGNVSVGNYQAYWDEDTASTVRDVPSNRPSAIRLRPSRCLVLAARPDRTPPSASGVFLRRVVR